MSDDRIDPDFRCGVCDACDEDDGEQCEVLKMDDQINDLRAQLAARDAEIERLEYALAAQNDGEENVRHQWTEAQAIADRERARAERAEALVRKLADVLNDAPSPEYAELWDAFYKARHEALAAVPPELREEKP